MNLIQLSPLVVLTAISFSAPLLPALHGQEDWFDDVNARERIASLKGSWHFSVGDDLAWAKPEFDDSEWTKVDVPDDWESEGYRDYNGYAWYRHEFKLPRDHVRQSLYLTLGKIDDVDQVFVNGMLIGGTGQFPPDYRTAYDVNRVYALPPGCLRPDAMNVIAVRVYDEGGRGGIYEGRPGVFSSDQPALMVNLEGPWIFQPGDNPAWAQPDADETGFQTINAPGYWENSGYPGLDGFAWYRIKFATTEKPTDSTMVLVLGRIDDLDEVYLNGTRIGGTGDLEHPRDGNGIAYYRQNRGYFFPASLLRGENVIAVRVFDREGSGGIYAGPLGIMAQKDYVQFWEQRRRDNTSLWHWLKKLD